MRLAGVILLLPSKVAKPQNEAAMLIFRRLRPGGQIICHFHPHIMPRRPMWLDSRLLSNLAQPRNPSCFALIHLLSPKSCWSKPARIASITAGALTVRPVSSRQHPKDGKGRWPRLMLQQCRMLHLQKRFKEPRQRTPACCHNSEAAHHHLRSMMIE